MAVRISDFDLKVYEREILPHLPPEVVDAHVLLGLREHFREVPSEETSPPELAFRHHLTFKGLFSNFRQILQYRKRRFVALPFLSREVEVGAANRYVAEGVRKRSVRGLVALNEASAGELLQVRGVVGGVLSPEILGENAFHSLDHQALSLIARKGGALLVLPPRAGAPEEWFVKGLLELASSFPSLKIVLARAGGALCPGTAERFFPLFAQFKNIHFDTAFVTSHKVMEVLLSHVGPRRVLFGSGAPYSFYRGYTSCHGGYSKLVILGRGGERHIPRSSRDTLLIYNILRAILKAAQTLRLDQEEVSSILCDNAKRVYFKAEQAG